MKISKEIRQLAACFSVALLAACTGYIEGPGPDEGIAEPEPTKAQTPAKKPPTQTPSTSSTPKPGTTSPSSPNTTTPSTTVNNNGPTNTPNGTSSGKQTEPVGNAAFSALLSKEVFEQMFAARSDFYTYEGLVEATNSYKAFANTGDQTAQKRELAAFLANAAHETGGLVYVEEIAKAEYCSPSAGCPCTPGKQYFGRGPIQLSWNYNYCAAGQDLGLPLNEDPDLVARDPKVAWQTTLWFWMTQKGAGTQTAHDAINNSGFGETIRTINGARECNGGNTEQVQSRQNYYQQFTSLLGVDPGGNLGC